MKARTKITLWTTSFALVVAIAFSGFVLYELMEQPFRLIDRELADVRDFTTPLLTKTASPPEQPITIDQHPFDRFWVTVTDEQNRPLLTTEMTQFVTIPAKSNEHFYFEKKPLALEHIYMADEDKEDVDDLSNGLVTFRVMQEDLRVNGTLYHILIAKPIPILVHEIYELVIEICCWLLLCTIVAVVVSYYLAGKILEPLAQINTLIKEISDVSLHKRIPLGKNQDELQTLSSSLNKMFDRLQFSFDRQKEYIGNASHELKSPLTILMLGHEKLLSEPLSEIARSGLEKQLNTLRRLSKLVRNLLEISRLEQQDSFTREQINLEELAQHLIVEFEEIINDKNITLHCNVQPARIIGDSEKILRMLINLLDNAIKYNIANAGEIWLSIKTIENTVQVTIVNTGASIPKESLPKIFDQFYRVEKSRSVKYGGAGLGLTIVKKIADLHKGSITVSSTPDGLTEFSICFPATHL
ncbi:HAMP domain-containing sensor histidine kinase [Desulforhopalus sp. IMCC35007]|uniref:sensor histidine kinase n=1 Tax=Desulforhopalus sp. IMCC35007 TaxID=2569543 RepID=UPI0010ADA8A3|nr:HAMP domain-containing sensor histidine kinase [Desulforhopalus sp. IMCC35007]TKB07617.1 HAMP domain-containing histidine kinase [Desulforhopalus sp. IMCC35007]